MPAQQGPPMNVLLIVSDDLNCHLNCYGKKSVVSPEGCAGCELYDLESDPGQFTNLACDPAHAAILGEMKTALHTGWKGAVP